MRLFKEADTAEGRMNQTLGCFLVFAVIIIGAVGYVAFKIVSAML